MNHELWQDAERSFKDSIVNLDEDNSELSSDEVTAKYRLLKLIMDNYYEIRHEFDYISEEYEKRNQPILARRTK